MPHELDLMFPMNEKISQIYWSGEISIKLQWSGIYGLIGEAPSEIYVEENCSGCISWNEKYFYSGKIIACLKNSFFVCY